MTEARPSKSADIASRERRYLVMMGIRVVCFVVAVVAFINGAGWLTAIPAVGAIIIPYFAVVFANGGREPYNTRGFRAYEPNLPDRFSPPDSGPAGRPQQPPGVPDDSGSGGNTGESGR